MLGPAQRSFRASCNGIEIRIRQNIDAAWIIIDQPGCERFYRELTEAELPAVLDRYHAIDGNAERFDAFVDSLLHKVPGAFAEEKCERE